MKLAREILLGILLGAVVAVGTVLICLRVAEWLT